MFQLPQFVWALRSSVCDVFINFLLIDATDRSKISSDQSRFFFAVSLPLSFLANTLFNTLSLRMLFNLFYISKQLGIKKLDCNSGTENKMKSKNENQKN